MEYPNAADASLVRRVDYSREPDRRWVLRDDNGRHFHAVVHLDESPLCLALYWKADSAGAERLVGVYEIELGDLLARGFVRRETTRGRDDLVRLRFVRGDDGVVYIQVNRRSPGLAVGVVSLG